MQVDSTTIQDLSVFHAETELSVFHHIDFTRTIGGHNSLKIFLQRPLNSLNKIEETQKIIQQIIKVHDAWPAIITNGTVMVVERFFETQLDEIPKQPNTISALSYKLLNGSDFSILKYSVFHFSSFVTGLRQILSLLGKSDVPEILQGMFKRIQFLLDRPLVNKIKAHDKEKNLTYAEIITLGSFLRRKFKAECYELIEIYSRLDAYYSMAMACINYGYVFPKVLDTVEPHLKVRELYHPLLSTPVAYDTELMAEKNFLFLTGANMAGKSTFIKAVGVSVYLAHVGMGVPAREMEISFFDGLHSNIQVVDNIVKGESFFFNEVQRIRKTIEKISNGKKWLILIDELFKGTNVQDAMKCSTTVIEGLLKMHNGIFILSTHLYEIGEALKKYKNIQFNFFETEVKDDQLMFSYHLKEGISNDRLGYLILKKEGVVDLLKKLT